MKDSRILLSAATSRRQFLTWFGLGAVAFAANACTAHPPYFTITITNAGTFDPSPLVVPLGATVAWYNNSSEAYTVTCDPAKVSDKARIQLPNNAPVWDSGILYPGQKWIYTFATVGGFLYTSTLGNSQSASGIVRVTT
jgi:plastocyanin